MKKRLIIGGGIVIVALVAILFHFISTPPSLEQEQKSSAPVPIASTEVFSVVVTPIARSVFAMAPDTSGTNGQQFIELATSTSVVVGTRIKTSDTGRAIIESTHDVFLNFSAEVVIASNDANGGSRIDLQTGKTWSRVKKVFDKGEFEELETPNAVAVVRGTSFGLYFEHGDTTTLIVTEGEVHLIAKDLQTGALLYDTEVAVGPGKKAVRKGAETIRVSAITTADKGEWFRFNNPKEPTSQNQPRAHTDVTATSTPVLSPASTTPVSSNPSPKPNPDPVAPGPVSSSTPASTTPPANNYGTLTR